MAGPKVGGLGTSNARAKGGKTTASCVAGISGGIIANADIRNRRRNRANVPNRRTTCRFRGNRMGIGGRRGDFFRKEARCELTGFKINYELGFGP